MDRYQRVEKQREEAPINENEIRITAQGRMRNYITYATTLLQEKGSNEITLKAMGRAINKTVMIAELIKRRIVGLHQNVSISSIDITDMWEPLEEGLLPLETTRHVSIITITLSKNQLDQSSTGYQPPIPSDQVKPSTEYEYGGGERSSPSRQESGRGGRGRGRSRVSNNNNNNNNGVIEYNGDVGWDGGRGYGYGGRGRGRGRGRGFRGYGRGYGGGNMQQSVGYNDYGGGNMQQSGGYNDYGGGNMQQAGGYNDYSGGAYVAQGRGRGRARSRGRGRGRGRGWGLRPNGPAQIAQRALD